MKDGKESANHCSIAELRDGEVVGEADEARRNFGLRHGSECSGRGEG
jgi:hypothetical protein